MKKYVMCLLLFFMLLIIPFSFAGENVTFEDPLLSVDDNGEILTQNDIYFDASSENDGNGSQSNPYKYLDNHKIQDNSVLHFADGEYDLKYGFDFSNLTIIGNNPLNTIIKGNNVDIYSSNSLYISNLTLTGLTIQNNYDLSLNNIILQNSYGNDFGGALYIGGSGNTVIESSTIKNNDANFGGAIYASGTPNIKILNSIFENNNAYKYGGAIAIEGNVRLEIISTAFNNCYSISNAGGAIYSREATLTINKSNFTSCNATFGGAICDLESVSSIDSIIAKNNKASYQGGAIYKMYGTIEVKSSTFMGNNALNGGAVYIDNSSSVSIYSSSFTTNTARYAGGAIYTILNSNETLKSITYKSNKADEGNNHYKAANYDLFIGNGDYTLFMGDFKFNGTLPSKYDLRDYGWVTSVKNQGSGGNCWAFTSLAALESCILKATGQTYDLSEENMKNVMAYYSDYGWKLKTNIGGYDDMGVGYLVGWLGAINEELDSYSVHSVLSPVLNSSIHVQNLVYLTRTDYTDNDVVKEAIVKYGAVVTGIYYSGSYNKGNSYYYSGTTGANHAVTIVGWDDTYSRSKFRNTPEGDGAWICKNSWGETWGDNGYFYVSYYDTRCVRLGENQKSTYTFILNDTAHYDKNYQYDIIGITDYLITGKDTIWYQNIFNATDDEILTAFSTYFNTTTNWTAEIYVNNALKLTQSGHVSGPGYFTFNLDESVPLKKGDTFKISIKISADSLASFPISEFVRSNRVLYSEGVSYFSYDGKKWTDLFNFTLDMSQYGHTYDSQVACIKAFTSLNTFSTTISIDLINSTVGVNVPFDVNAIVKDVNGNMVNYGNVKFTIDSKTYTAPVVNGKATITTKLANLGSFKIKADYIENDYYHKSSTSRNVNVKVLEANLTLEISDINYGDKVTVKNMLISNGFIVQGNVNVKINSKSYTVKSNSETTINAALKPGNYPAYATYSNVANATTNFNVNKLPITMKMSIKKTDVDAADITVKLSKSINGSVSVKVNSKSYSLKAVNGVATLNLKDLDYGNYSAYATFKNTYYQDANASGSFSVTNIKTKLIADNVTLYYHNGTRFVVTLVDKDNNPIGNETVKITIYGTVYDKKTNENGKCSIPLNLNSGNYTVTVNYSGNGIYLSSKLNRAVVVKSTVIADDIVKIYKNATPFKALILDGQGNPVKKTNITMNINGVFYTRSTNDEGIVRLNLNLVQGKYVLTTINHITGENGANNITIIPSIVENHDLVKYYRNDSRYSVKVLGPDGSPLAGAKVTFNINGVFYEKTTNTNGKATLGINLVPGKYVITAEYNGCRVSNNIEVLPIIKTSDLTMKYRNGSQFKALILDGLGKPYPSQVVTFNINGVFYERTTHDNGVAVLNIYLQPGKYIITTSFNELNAANTITISN